MNLRAHKYSLWTWIFTAVLAVGSVGIQAESDPKHDEADDAPFAWHLLRQVEWKEVETEDGSLYGFDYQLVVDDSILALEGSRLKMDGYLTPLTDGDAHSEFLFTMSPHSGCSHCAEMSLTNTLIATARAPLEFTDAQVFIEGTLHVVPEDKQGVLYRMSDVVLLKTYPAPSTSDEHHLGEGHFEGDGHDH